MTSFVNADAEHDQLTAVVQHELVAVSGAAWDQDAATVGVGENEWEAREVGRLPIGQLEDCAPAKRGSGLGRSADPDRTREAVVVAGARRRITEDLVGAHSRGESLPAARLPVDIGVMATGNLSVRATDVLGRRVSRDSQLGVGVDLGASSHRQRSRSASPGVARSRPSMGPERGSAAGS
jgi:hypothetical protein